MPGPYVIRVSSTKGGVGKSVIATNLAVAVNMYGYDTLLIDKDMANPSVGVYMGLEDVSIGLSEVMKGKATFQSATIPHPASGVRVLPQRIDTDVLQFSPAEVRVFGDKIKKSDYKFIIVDTEPGIQYETTIKWYDEAFVITTPYEAACISAIKLMSKYGKAGVKTTIIVNRVENKSHELSIKEIEEMCEQKVSGILKEDDKVKVGVSEHIPVYLLDRKSPFSRGIDEIAKMLISRSGSFGKVPRTGGDGFLSGIKKKL
ncbi:MAG: P-loop NTPase [Candidatus Micrarchaeales archaeon]